MGGTTTGGMSANPLFGNKALEKSFHLGNRSVTENSADISMITLFFLLLESRRFFFLVVFLVYGAVGSSIDAFTNSVIIAH